jgi:hypothetical protein
MEWTQGLGNNPSIELLNREQGATWRKDSAGTFFFFFAQIKSNVYL